MSGAREIAAKLKPQEARLITSGRGAKTTFFALKRLGLFTYERGPYWYNAGYTPLGLEVRAILQENQNA